MKIIRFLSDSDIPLTGILHADGSAEPINGDLLGVWTPTGRRVRITKLLAPLRPSVILAIGLNFREHALETKQPVPEFPVLFMKSPWVIQNPGDPILIPTHLASTQVDYEAELVVILGKDCKNATRENAMGYVFGYTCGNDVTARDWQKSFGGNQWCRGKSFDTFAPLGPCIVTKEEIPDRRTSRSAPS
jgi:2-keto-4-pentenoate hydratase/2-oxohepta-3-ene-1,7-dioic acid hydratase in catechol pathway